MKLSVGNMNHLLPAFGKNWVLFLFWGLALIILGIAALLTVTFATLLSVFILGFFIFLSGAVILIDTLTFWWRKWRGFFLHLIAALSYLIVGLILIFNPLLASISLTLLLGVFFLIIGVFRIVFATFSRFPNWGFLFTNGIITLILGMLILGSWPGSSLFVIGMFIGIDLVLAGFSYIMSALAGKEVKEIMFTP